MTLIRRHCHKLFWGLPLLMLLGYLVFIFNVKSQTETRLYLEPAKNSLTIGNDFTAALNLETKQDINTVQARINFSKDYLEVINISKDKSLISVWIEEPSFDNQNGVINLQGIVPNPGFRGRGRVALIRFKAKKAGIVNLEFSESSVLANDGKGTDVLESTSGASYQINDPVKAQKQSSGDINNDGKLNLIDLSILVAKVGTSDSKYDLNGDGKVNLFDLSILVSKIGK